MARKKNRWVNGLVGGITLMLAGIYMVHLGGDGSSGAGIMYILGGLVFIPGAIITVISLIGWLSSQGSDAINADAQQTDDAPDQEPKSRNTTVWGFVGSIIWWFFS